MDQITLPKPTPGRFMIINRGKEPIEIPTILIPPGYQMTYELSHDRGSPQQSLSAKFNLDFVFWPLLLVLVLAFFWVSRCELKPPTLDDEYEDDEYEDDEYEDEE